MLLGLRPAPLLGNINTSLVWLLPAGVDCKQNVSMYDQHRERVFTWSLLALLDGLPPTLLGVLALLVVGRMRRMGRVRR